MTRPLRYSINVTLDGCCDHRAVLADEDLHRHAAENIAQADALLFGRVTYDMMETAWRPSATGARPDWMADWMVPFARTIDAAKKYVVSSTLDQVDWNAELVRGDLGNAVQQLKQDSGKGLLVGGVKLPLALAELGLIDEYEFVVQPRLAGHGPTLLAGLSKYVDLTLVSRLEFSSGAVVQRYEPRRPPATTLAALFREAGSAHHGAFASTNGDDPDWPSWYAQYVGPRLEQLVGRSFESHQLAQDFKAMDAEHRSGGGQEPWPEFYARWFRKRYSL